MKNRPKSYISAHLFYGDNLNLLLKKGIEPFIKKYKNKFSIWFFIRYNEDGQHIRLRIRINESNMEEMKAIMINCFTHFFEKYPSKNTNIPYEKYPDNSIQFIDYQQEIERYGVSIAIYYFFNKSSKFILQYLDENLEYENALIVALLMNFHLVCAFSKGEKRNNSIEKSNKIIIEIYQTIYDNWLKYTLHHTQFSKEKIEQQFNNIYQQQEAILNELIHDVLQEHHTQKFDNDEFSHWKPAVVGYFSDILNSNYNSTKAKQILRDFVHLNNNRFGISNFDEPLLAYLTLRCMGK
ncbi:MAG: thiopeptide-type bacteriocin biosynthesis protein [Saprospiraceae bacterium]